MQLNLDKPPDSYSSGTQRARVATEPWAAENLFCPNCPSPRLESLKPNTPAADFMCPRCREWFQLKSGRSPFRSRIPDAAYSKMVEAIREDRTPSLFTLHYDLTTWRVRNLILIPRFAYSLKDIYRRPPLSPRARRHDWVGCDILLGAIPQSARIPVIADGVFSTPRRVRQQFARLKPLKRIRTGVRGWTLDVFRVVESLGKRDFSLPEVYAFEEELRQLHPGNRFITPKIRQQLQRLRDLGLLEFLGSGRYRLT